MTSAFTRIVAALRLLSGEACVSIIKKMYDPSKRHVELTATEGRRFKTLGDIGESLAFEILNSNHFNDIVDLNECKVNFPFADFSAVKGNYHYLISVKARNKYERSGKLNSRYKLGSKVYEHIDALLKRDEYRNFIPAWLAISIEIETYDAFFGTIDQLKGGRGINMSPKATQNYEELALGVKHNYDFADFGNIYSEKC